MDTMIRKSEYKYIFPLIIVQDHFMNILHHHYTYTNIIDLNDFFFSR